VSTNGLAVTGAFAATFAAMLINRKTRHYNGKQGHRKGSVMQTDEQTVHVSVIPRMRMSR
jgi:hypothetical protein